MAPFDRAALQHQITAALARVPPTHTKALVVVGALTPEGIQIAGATKLPHGWTLQGELTLPKSQPPEGSILVLKSWS